MNSKHTIETHNHSNMCLQTSLQVILQALHLKSHGTQQQTIQRLQDMIFLLTQHYKATTASELTYTVTGLTESTVPTLLQF